MSDLEVLSEMFGRAKPFAGYEWLEFARATEEYEQTFADGQTVYDLLTGPDDAVARFVFSPDGELLTVSVDEC